MKSFFSRFSGAAFFLLFFLFPVFPSNSIRENVDESRRLQIDERLVWQALSEGVDSASEFIQDVKLEGGKKEVKKKKKKKFFKRLLKTVITLAAKLAVKEILDSTTRSRDDIKAMVVRLCEEFYETAKLDGHDFTHEEDLPCLHCIFLIEDKIEIERLIYEKLNASVHEENKFLQTLFSELFDYCSKKLDVINKYFCCRVLKKFKQLSHENSADLSENIDSCEICYKVALHVIEKTSFKGFNDRNRINIPAILCFVKIMVDIGELAFDSKLEYSLDGKETFLKRVIALLHELYDFLSSDHLLESLKKLSTFLEKLDNAQSEEEWHKIVESFFKTTEEGLIFLEEFFSNLRIYLKAKLSEIFSQVFYNLSEAINE